MSNPKWETEDRVKCQSHFRDLNKKISIFAGCYSTATREKHNGWSDDDYIPQTLELYCVKEEGREVAKKKSRATSSKSSTSRKPKLAIDEEFSNLSSAHENLEKSMETTVSAMLEYASSQNEVARAKKFVMWMILKNK
ncbi:hypothetical protein LIER_37328 [Lithospermum erythrorhizon]|uniref:No apical meristem-associated C-terminal domain-containing protein n=1 Tax=Lithospermum erythrorhizon TaxID=34254 RepID=A0AAV3PL71_LITER